MPNVSKTQLAWLAGIVDGEGSITITSDKRRGRTNIQHTTRICITNTNNKIIEEVEHILCTMNVFHRRTTRPATKGHKAVMDVFIRAASKYMFLEQVKSYLVAKAEHAQYMQEYIQENSKQFHGYSVRSLDLVIKLAQLNKRGTKI